MTNNGQKFLKITSILMIVGGIIAVIAGVIAILGVSALAALAGSAEGTALVNDGAKSKEADGESTIFGSKTGRNDT